MNFETSKRVCVFPGVLVLEQDSKEMELKTKNEENGILEFLERLILFPEGTSIQSF